MMMMMISSVTSSWPARILFESAREEANMHDDCCIDSSAVVCVKWPSSIVFKESLVQDIQWPLARRFALPIKCFFSSNIIAGGPVSRS